ncbi:hypothetical protein Moror_11989 [Moniliophthora roreri MCA 2997]|uniref:Uncharacterized protein n=1 Tax=Moniliophthora roreri (strain MCA 2997) TaxID=1381753 RepID=V2Y5U7_MONRO|nr:hypothetical protein Moror_11989 [Moniliophthora roreri MCA 2997]
MFERTRTEESAGDCWVSMSRLLAASPSVQIPTLTNFMIHCLKCAAKKLPHEVSTARPALIETLQYSFGCLFTRSTT